MMRIEIQPERAGDAPLIRQITEAAFKLNDHSDGTEGVQAKYFMRLAFNGPVPAGRVSFHEGFGAH